MKTGWRVAARASFASLGIAASAAADVRYAEPQGNGDGNVCLQSDPCELQVAVNDISVQDGDEVVVLPGIYDLTGDHFRSMMRSTSTARPAPGRRSSATTASASSTSITTTFVSLTSNSITTPRIPSSH